MKKILLFLVLHLSYLSFSQVGIGTTTPRGALDINNPTTAIFGLVLPTNDSPDNMINPQGGNIAFGTIMYDSKDDCIRYYQTNTANDSIEKWSSCILKATDRNAFKLNYIPIGKSFTSNYKKGVTMTAANTFRIAVTNEGYSPVTVNFSPSDLVLSGIEGITATSVSPTSATLNAGATVELTYRLSGAPADCGILTGTWTKLDLQYSAPVNVAPSPIYNCTQGSWNESVIPEEYKLNGLISGQSYTGTYTIPYTDDTESNCDIPAETITKDGLTLTYTGGPVSATGTITYTLSGTYTGRNNGSVTFVTNTGCWIYLGPFGSCKELLEKIPDTPSGLYYFDLHKNVNTSPYINRLYCDMTTDGGGWALVARNGSTSRTGQTARNLISEPTDNGYLPRTTVTLIANTGSQVQLRSGNSPTNYAHKITSQPGGAAILALRSGGNVNGGSATWHRAGAVQDFMNNPTIRPIGTWNWEVSCQTSAVGWPKMYHSCGITNNVHWLMDFIEENRTSISDPWASTWIR
ncbi:hypothetical protein SAMN05443634_10133 [Chishuiella changwenlii]|uniref:Fibrinogen beta and gamma chains, C-terminal globular domain n=1 Tax=Chishuiella changwenlii TaxID=1434701 RepID=A0A1M6SLV4_9FLAO|nr:fibrinogen-like YCDxxxxGGGW domain-containing protein [Chishuiella changwenlii]SHK45617.1 hypothetical protein SAMN05443634_10133 [Chishuiella changwenlii]